MSDDLDPLAPEAAAEMYLDTRREELSSETRRSHGYRLNAFADWCEEQGIHNLNDLDARDLHAYRVDRREDGLKPVTLQGQLSTVRQLLRFAASLNAVPENLPEKIMLPTVGVEDQSNDEKLDSSRAKSIIEYLDRYEYASIQHVEMVLMWRTSCRRGGLRALDVGDFDRDEPAVEFRHRPETDTPLKNGVRSERDVSLREPVARVVADYIDDKRRDVTDDHGRRPLLTTGQGRPALSTIQDHVYRITRPCCVGEGCPHDRDPETCEAMESAMASKCPSSRSPHRVRTGSLTAHRDAGTPRPILSDRADVSEPILDEHYDKANEREKMRRRRDKISEDL